MRLSSGIDTGNVVDVMRCDALKDGVPPQMVRVLLTVRPHRSRISIRDCSFAVTGCEFRNRADPREYGAPCYKYNISFVPFEGTHFYSRTPARSMQICKRPGLGHSVNNQF